MLHGPPTHGTWSPVDLDLVELLLEGFVKRTSDRELVRPPAATPQKEVLVHVAMQHSPPSGREDTKSEEGRTGSTQRGLRGMSRTTR